MGVIAITQSSPELQDLVEQEQVSFIVPGISYPHRRYEGRKGTSCGIEVHTCIERASHSRIFSSSVRGQIPLHLWCFSLSTTYVVFFLMAPCVLSD